MPGDEGALADALRRFGEDESVDPSQFLSMPGAVFFLAEEDGVPVGRAYGHTLAHPDGETTMLLYAIDLFPTPGAAVTGGGWSTRSWSTPVPPDTLRSGSSPTKTTRRAWRSMQRLVRAEMGRTRCSSR